MEKPDRNRDTEAEGFVSSEDRSGIHVIKFQLDKMRFDDIISKCDHVMESWLSGLRRTTGNRVYVDSVPRVQIPNSPP